MCLMMTCLMEQSYIPVPQLVRPSVWLIYRAHRLVKVWKLQIRSQHLFQPHQAGAEVATMRLVPQRQWEQGELLTHEKGRQKAMYDTYFRLLFSLVPPDG